MRHQTASMAPIPAILDPANVEIGYTDALIRSRAMAQTVTDAATFGAEIAAAYATKGGAIELGTAKLGDALVPEAAVRLPLATMNRHGLIAGATGTGKTRTLQVIAEQLSAAGVAVFAADVKGDVSGMAVPGSTDGPAKKRATELGLAVHAHRLPGRVPLARRHRPRSTGARDRLRLRAAAPREGARLERDAGAEPRARLPLRRREGPPAPRPVGSARAADVPRLRGRARGAEGHRRPVAADRGRPPALARRARDRRRQRVLRRAPARRGRSPANGRGRARRDLVPRAAGGAGQATALVDRAHVARRRALRAAARGRRPRASRGSSSSSTRRTSCSRVRARRSSSRRCRRCGSSARRASASSS